ncbi:MAG: hypothetical protein BGO90_12020 [Legionella sp. 40-6]|nr:peroxide stress protein YaaA [Legionella sp.]OJY58400.1 MAG: hypothetical protein BGO90_12020 [Legionella sp. 40-6]
MIILLSPAKKLLDVKKPYSGKTTRPQFLAQTNSLIEIMRSKSVAEIAKLMDLSESLAQLNFTRYQEFQENGDSPKAYPALFYFQGDVYQGLQAKTWDTSTVDYAQNHLRMLSGLYGMLRPLDLMQPYRLEMGTHLENSHGKTLYDFWQNRLTAAINEELAEQKNPLLINLASTEYFKAIDQKQLQFPILTIDFYERRDGELKMIGIYAKKARGLMAKFIMQQQIDEPEGLKGFQDAGYLFASDHSSATHLSFIRGK